MPVYQVTEEVQAVRFRTLVIVADSEEQVVDLYSKGSYLEEMKWYEEDESSISFTATEVQPN